MRQAWRALAAHLAPPRAIVAVSAHWTTEAPHIGSHPRPPTVHDFHGFPPALNALRYPAPGDPERAREIRALLARSGIAAEEDPLRGLDHGVWVPLRELWPAAEIPVIPLSLQPAAGPAWHETLGAALRPLREHGILLLASGAITHNFAWLGRGPAPHPRARAFTEWIAGRLAANQRQALRDYRRQAPDGAAAHPEEEHLLPLFVALGAGEGPPVRIDGGFTHGGLSMDAYLWNEAGTPA